MYSNKNFGFWASVFFWGTFVNTFSLTGFQVFWQSNGPEVFIKRKSGSLRGNDAEGLTR